MLRHWLLRAHREFHIEYHRFFSSHLAHDLLALHALGASDERLERCFNEHATHLIPRIVNDRTIQDDTWQVWIGKRDRYDDYLQYFDDIIARDGIVATVKKYTPRLLPGMLGSAVHPLIHLGYGVEFVQDIVVAEGLAYCAHSFLDLSSIISDSEPLNVFSKEEASLLNVLEKMQHADIWSSPIQATQFQGRVKELAVRYQPQLHDIVNQFLPSRIDDFDEAEVIEELGKATATMYASRLPLCNDVDFFHAHAITSFHATCQLLPYLEMNDKIKALRLQAAGLTLIYLAQGRGPISEKAIQEWSEGRERQGKGLTWDDIVQLAIESDDEHVCKVVYVCRSKDAKSNANARLWKTVAEMTVVKVKHAMDWRYGEDPAKFIAFSRISG